METPKSVAEPRCHSVLPPVCICSNISWCRCGGPHWPTPATLAGRAGPVWPILLFHFLQVSCCYLLYTSINIHCVVAESSNIESLWLGSERSRASGAMLAESEFVSSESLDDSAMSDGSCGGGGGRLVMCSVANNLAGSRPSVDADESDGASLFCWQVAPL